LVRASEEQLHQEFNRDLADALLQIRHILLSHEAATEIADVTHVDRQELHEPEMSRAHRCLVALDPFVGVVIVLNAASTGLQLEVQQGWEGWQWIEVIFTLIFTLEVLLKITLQGILGFFTGKEQWWNMFDLVSVLFAVLDALIWIFGHLSSLGSFAIFRLLRFGRLTRLVKVLKLSAFKELRLLVNGLVAGVRTLFWAIVLLGFFVFCIAVFLRQTVGNVTESIGGCDVSTCVGINCTNCNDSALHLIKYREILFGTLGRSMLTVFRCLTDGCSSVDGTPLPIYSWEAYGLIAVILYVVVILFVTFGNFCGVDLRICKGRCCQA